MIHFLYLFGFAIVCGSRFWCFYLTGIKNANHLRVKSFRAICHYKFSIGLDILFYSLDIKWHLLKQKVWS